MIFQIIFFYLCFSPKIEVNSIFDRDSVHKVVNFNSGVSGVVFVSILFLFFWFLSFFFNNTPYPWSLY